MSSVSSKIALRVAERNSWDTYSPKKVNEVFRMLWQNRKEVVFQRGLPTTEWLDEHFPLKDIDWPKLRSPTSPDIIQSTWIGHATAFLQLGNFNVLTDPVFSARCSGLQFAGPLRYRKPACTIEEMMEKEKIAVDVVLISHNHYDHLDYNSVKKLAQIAIVEKRPIQFIVPLGLMSWFKKYVPLSMKGGNKVLEIDWHESCEVQGKEGTNLCVTSVPVQHWTSRYGYDRDKTLWCGYSIKISRENQEGDGANILFTGDTGWFEEAKDEIGRHGPFDLALIPIGAYEPRWFMKAEHIDPIEAVKLMDAVKAKRAFPIHWGTFPLTTEPVLEPRDKLAEAMKAAGKDPSTFSASLIGETMIYD